MEAEITRSEVIGIVSAELMHMIIIYNNEYQASIN